MGRRGIPLFLILTAVSGSLQARTIRVPRDYMTIKMAVAASADGDTVEVDDGYYFERNIIVDKRIRVTAKNPYGAVIYGSNPSPRYECVFIVRAEAEIDGFILKNSDIGIEQRHSPDVKWRAHDLAIFNMRFFGIGINAVKGNTGSAEISNVIINKCNKGVYTNDAGRMTANNLFISECESAFSGSNHLEFLVGHSLLLDNEFVSDISTSLFPAPATNRIRSQGDILVLNQAGEAGPNEDAGKIIERYFPLGNERSARELSYARRRKSILLSLVGEADLKQGRPIEAERFFGASLAAAEAEKFLEVILQSSFGLARAGEKRGAYAEAIRNIRKSAATIDAITESLPLWIYKPNYYGDKIRIIEFHFELLHALHGREPGGGYDREAFLLAEKTKASGLIAALGEFSLKEQLADSGAIRSREAAVGRKISAIQNRLSRIRKPADRRKSLEDLEKAEDEYLALLIRQKRAFDAQMPRPSFQPVGIDGVRETLLPADTALVEYFVGENAAFAFCLTRARTKFVRLGDPRELEDWVLNYYSFLTLTATPEFKGAPGGRKLAEYLISPFREDLTRAIRKLIIVPDGILHYLPFETLPGSFPDGGAAPAAGGRSGAPFLVESREIGYAPSATFLALLRESAAPERPPRDLLAAARPDAESAYENPAARVTLPFAQAEIEQLARLFDRTKTTLLNGPKASERSYKRMPLADYKILHFAVHGIFNEANWLRSALILGRDPGDDDDGLLQPNEISRLRIRADLVVLSSCRSAEGRIEKGEGFLGLSTPFLAAGAKTIVAALWPIDDRATARFMTSFYARLAKGDSKAGALRQAKMDLLKSEYAHPFYWGAFILTGESSRPVPLKGLENPAGNHSKTK